MKKQLHASSINEQLNNAVQAIRNGQLVIFPTDTVYGLGADPLNEQALSGLFTLKKRPLDKGIPILIADSTYLPQLVKEIPPAMHHLMDRFWPGGLTIIFEKKEHLPSILSPNKKIAIRQPDNQLAMQLLQLAGGMLATTSANFSGKPPVQSAAEATALFSKKVGAILDGGVSANNIPSTIIDGTTHPPQLIREGAIPFTAIMKEL